MNKWQRYRIAETNFGTLVRTEAEWQRDINNHTDSADADMFHIQVIEIGALGECQRELEIQNTQIRKENERLIKIIKQEASENDEFGAEFLCIVILRDENKKLKKDLDEAEEVIKKLLHCPDINYLSTIDRADDFLKRMEGK